MRHNERNYDSDNRYRGSRSDDNHDLSNYQSRYQNRGNYYGMPDQDSEYRGMSSQGRNYGGSTSGPGGGYGASSWRSSRDQDDYRSQGRGSSYGNRERDNYNYGSSRSQSDHYRYGDPNPYMNNQRQGGYERDRDTDWRREGDIDQTNRRYARQENSYRQTGHGRRFDQYGQDERYNYSHGPQDGRRSIEDSENLDDRYYDRGEHSRSSSDNDYGRHYGSNYEHRNSNRGMRDDHHESSRLARNSRSGHDDSPSRSPRGYGYPSGPDYSANSPITNYGPSVRGYQK